MESNHNVVLAVVVTYNRKKLLRQNLHCLLAQEGASCDILVVDNASTDGTASMIADEFSDPRITYFNTGANLGGAGGFHVGLYWAATSSYEYVWIMDDDSMPSKTALVKLLEAGKRVGEWGFLSSAVYWTDGSLCLANRPKKDLFRHIGADDLRGGPVRVRMGSFVSMLVPTAVVREVGLPMAEYFIWTDDYEFSGRISKLYPCYFVPGSEVTHAMAANTRANLLTAEGERAQRFKMLYRNDVHCYRQHGLEGWAYLVAKGVYTAAQVVAHGGSDAQTKLDALITGYRDGMSFSPEVVRVETSNVTSS